MLSIKEIATAFIIAADPTPTQPTPPEPKTPEPAKKDKPKFGAGKGSRPQPPPMNKSLRPRRRG
jgi:hypothetical protein